MKTIKNENLKGMINTNSRDIIIDLTPEKLKSDEENMREIEKLAKLNKCKLKWNKKCLITGKVCYRISNNECEIYSYNSKNLNK